ncbi:MAG: hypothetical protein MI923_27770 [Phycisphaerales bacterium]|nr:hypothetical protein [Phycisphaerales bacterium]
MLSPLNGRHRIFGLIMVVSFFTASGEVLATTNPKDTETLIAMAVTELIKMQDTDGAWPYEGVYRVRGEIPIGYRVGGTALVCEAILHATSAEDITAVKSLERGIEFILEGLEDPLMAPSTRNRYDVRIWGHAYALEFFCQYRAAGREGPNRRSIDEWISRLVATIVQEELPSGGWHYANRRRHASFVTAPVTQALLWARFRGAEVPAAVFDRARNILAQSRLPSGAFHYSGTKKSASANSPTSAVAGSIARSAVCEATLSLLGGGSADAVGKSVDAFYEHWDELEKRRKKHGTHVGPYGIAPYYFYFGHRYAAQAIELLTPEVRPRERARLHQVLLRTRDVDGTWNDRVFPRSRNYGTAMAVLALLADRVPLPHALSPAGTPIHASPDH